MPLAEALDLAARCGAACITRRGPFDGQLDRERVLAPRPPGARFASLRGGARTGGLGRPVADGAEPERGEQIAQRELLERVEH